MIFKAEANRISVVSCQTPLVVTKLLLSLMNCTGIESVNDVIDTG